MYLETRNFINGNFINSLSKQKIKVINPGVFPKEVPDKIITKLQKYKMQPQTHLSFSLSVPR